MPGTRLIGLVGGMSWQSTALYYRKLNEKTEERLGAHHNARCLINTVDFEDLLAPALSGDWDAAAWVVADAAQKLEHGRAEILALTSVTGHFAAQTIRDRVRLPFVDLGEALGEELCRRQIATVACLGTKKTLTGGFFIEPLREKFGLEVLRPSGESIDWVNSVIIDELTRGVFSPDSKRGVLDVANMLRGQGAEAIVLACTELPLLVGSGRTGEFIDVVDVHVDAILDHALA
jgi:aspartate racemase